jgi:CHRD domain
MSREPLGKLRKKGTRCDGTWTVRRGIKLTDEQYASFQSGNLYVNVHSAEHKPGEIRAQLKP